MRNACFAVLVSLALTLSGASIAQDLPSVPAAQSVTPRKLELATELIEASGAKSQIQNMLRGMGSQIAANASNRLSAEQKTQMQVILDAESDALAKSLPKLLQAMATEYAETYSDQELSDILAFYKSPPGQAMIQKAPQLMQGLMGSIFKIMPEVQHDAGERICAKITCTAAQKAAFMGETPPKP